MKSKKQTRRGIEYVINFIKHRASEKDLVRLQEIFDDYTCKCWNFNPITNKMYLKSESCRVHNTKKQIREYNKSSSLVVLEKMIKRYSKENGGRKKCQTP